jgi:2-C-methyl-D-erythritol 4-phosphate cytidylyltransferase
VTAQQAMRSDVAVLVAAAGLGTRLGPGPPKALRQLGGVPLLVHAVRRVGQASHVGHVTIAAPPFPGAADDVRRLVAADVPAGVTLTVIPGGDTRQTSVLAALRATPDMYPIVLVHDAARAFAPAALLERVAAAVRAGHDAVIPVLPVTDTIKQVDESGYVHATVDRAVLRAVQTPQGFRREVLWAAHEAATDAVTDDSGLVEQLGVPVFCVPGAAEALKITGPADLAFADVLLRAEDAVASGATLVP